MFNDEKFKEKRKKELIELFPIIEEICSVTDLRLGQLLSNVSRKHNVDLFNAENGVLTKLLKKDFNIEKDDSPELIDVYKIKTIRTDYNTQLKKNTYESLNKFMRYGKDIYKRYHNKKYQYWSTVCEIYQMDSGSKWIKIEVPEEFIN